MKRWLERRWYDGHSAPALLLPFSSLYGRIAGARRRRLQAEQPALPVPVIVVGNISLGGTGKTPLVIWLVEHLRQWGFRPGVISRGYGGHSRHYPLRVSATSDPALCGDEPLLIAMRTGAPLAVAPDRLAAAQLLIDSGEIDVLVADDGLQHYRLPRDLEICVVDGRRGLGNGALLPAGPLRELPRRLEEVDFVVVNGDGFVAGDPQAPIRMHLQAAAAQSLTEASRRQPLASFAAGPVHAVAGIGHPQRFFDSLRAQGLEQLMCHPFPDHHRYRAEDLAFGDGHPVLMTEKDAVKCRAFADARMWSLPVSAQLSSEAEERVRESCQNLKRDL